jgi:probable rRNA maturation factor
VVSALLFVLWQEEESLDLIILERKIVGLSAASLQRFILGARKATGLRGKVNLLLTDNAQMRALNLQFRRKDKPTDVLSFPPDFEREGENAFAGEIAISADIASDNATRLGHSPAIEVKILALHGILHLAGFDHESDNGQMARKESALRRTLGLPSSLTERSGSRRHRPAISRPPTRSRGRRRTA